MYTDSGNINVIIIDLARFFARGGAVFVAIYAAYQLFGPVSTTRCRWIIGVLALAGLAFALWWAGPTVIAWLLTLFCG